MLKWQKQGQAAIYGVERSRKKSGKMYARRGSFSLADLQNEYSSGSFGSMPSYSGHSTSGESLYTRTGPGYGGHGGGRRAARPPVDQTLYGDDGNECFCRVSSIIKAFLFLIILAGGIGGGIYAFVSYNSTSNSEEILNSGLSTTPEAFSTPISKSEGILLEEKSKYIQQNKNILDQDFLYNNVIKNDLPEEIKNQLRGVLEIFKAKESLLNIPDVSNSEPYQKKEEKESSATSTTTTTTTTSTTTEPTTTTTTTSTTTTSTTSSTKKSGVLTTRLPTSRTTLKSTTEDIFSSTRSDHEVSFGNTDENLNASVRTFRAQPSSGQSINPAIRTFRAQPANILVDTEPKESLAFVERPVASTRFLNTVTATNSISPGDPIGISPTKASHNFPGSFETTSEEFLGLEKLFKNIKSSVKVVQGETKFSDPTTASTFEKTPTQTTDIQLESRILPQLSEEEDETFIEPSEEVETVTSGFITVAPGILPTGLVTEIERTIISDGMTSLYQTAVTGTTVHGSYAQILATVSTVFQEEGEIEGFTGEVEIDETPRFDLENNDIDPSPPRNRESKSADLNEENSEERVAANQSFKERLKQRFQKFRQSSKGILDTSTDRNRVQGFSSRNKNYENNSDVTERSKFSRGNESLEEDEEDEDEDQSGERPRFGYINRSNVIRNKIREVLQASSSTTSSFSVIRTFQPSRTFGKPSIEPTSVTNVIQDRTSQVPSFFKSFNRFNRPDIRKSFLNKVLSLDNDDEKSQNIEDTNIDENVDNKKELEPEESTTSPNPSDKNEDFVGHTETPLHSITNNDQDNSDKFDNEDSTLNPIGDKDFENTNKNEETSSESDFVGTLVNEDGDIEDNTEITNEENILEVDVDLTPEQAELNRLLTTLDALTVTSEQNLLQVLTIRSPYTFDISDGKSTRFITVTRTQTITPTKSVTLPVATVLPQAKEFRVGKKIDLPTYDHLELDSSKQVFSIEAKASKKTPPLELNTSITGSSSSELEANEENRRSDEAEKKNENNILHQNNWSKNINTDENFLTLAPFGDKDFLPFHSVDFQDQIQPSFQSSIPSVSALENLANIPLNIKQLEYLQQLKAALKPQLVLNSIPQVETKTVYKTNTLKLIQDNKEFSTELLTPIGLTRVTKFEIVTSTLLPRLDALPPVPSGLPLLQDFKTTTQLVVKTIELSTQTLKTNTQEYRIIFRNTPITTTLTNTQLVETVLTSLTTVTQTIALSLNPFAGFIG